MFELEMPCPHPTKNSRGLFFTGAELTGTQFVILLLHVQRERDSFSVTGAPTRYRSLFGGIDIMEGALAIMQTETEDLTVQLHEDCMSSYFVAPDLWEPFCREFQFSVKTNFEQGSEL